jgi:hypothetical protein
MLGERRDSEEHNEEKGEERSDPANETEVIEGPRMGCAQGKAMVLSELNMTVQRLGSNTLAGRYVPRVWRTSLWTSGLSSASPLPSRRILCE